MQTLQVPLTLSTSASEEDVTRARNEEVSVEAALFEAERTHLEAVAAYEAGDAARADGLLAGLAATVESQAADFDDGRLSAKLEALTVEREQMSAAAAPAERQAYLKSSKQRLYQAKSGKRAGYLLQVGDEGLEVERLQTALADKGYWSGPVDGKYSKQLEEAVDAYQGDEGIRRDGVAGPSTLQTLGLY